MTGDDYERLAPPPIFHQGKGKSYARLEEEEAAAAAARNPRGSGRKPHNATEERKKLVTVLASLDFNRTQISKFLDIELPTLKKHYDHEIENGKKLLDVEALSALYENIKARKEKSVIYYLASRVPGFMQDPNAAYNALAVATSPAPVAQIESTPQTLQEADALYESLRK